MAFVSILLPAFYFEDGNDISSQVSRQLGLKNHSFELCRVLSPLPAGAHPESAEPPFEEYAVKLLNSDLNIHRIEMLLEEQNITSKKVEKCKEALTTLSREFNNLVHNPEVLKEVDNQKLAKRTKKLKQIKEDNRKLRYLLKVHMDNSEKMRVETQTTIETLREEFDLLVKELSNLQKGAAESNTLAHPLEQQQQSQQSHFVPPQVPVLNFHQDNTHHQLQQQQQLYSQQQQQQQRQPQFRQDPRFGQQQQQPQQFQLNQQVQEGTWYQSPAAHATQQQPIVTQTQTTSKVPFTSLNVPQIATANAQFITQQQQQQQQQQQHAPSNGGSSNSRYSNQAINPAVTQLPFKIDASRQQQQQQQPNSIAFSKVQH